MKKAAEFHCPICGRIITTRNAGAWINVDRDTDGLPARLTVDVKTIPYCWKCRENMIPAGVQAEPDKGEK